MQSLYAMWCVVAFRNTANMWSIRPNRICVSSCVGAADLESLISDRHHKTMNTKMYIGQTNTSTCLRMPCNRALRKYCMMCCDLVVFLWICRSIGMLSAYDRLSAELGGWLFALSGKWLMGPETDWGHWQTTNKCYRAMFLGVACLEAVGKLLDPTWQRCTWTDDGGRRHEFKPCFGGKTF